MATNVQNPRTTDRIVDPPVTETVPTPVVVPASVGGVAVYDRPVDGTTSSTVRPSASLVNDPAPINTQSGPSMLAWIIGAIVLIVLAYFLLQLIF